MLAIFAILVFSDFRNVVNFASFAFVYPARERVAASNDFIGDTAFSSDVDMSSELLSLVRRTNKQIIESEGSGVVIARASE